MLEVYGDLHRQILDVFNEYGVQIMTPAYMADPPRAQDRAAVAVAPGAGRAITAGIGQHAGADCL